LVGKAADVLENVEKIEWNGKKLGVNFYDKEANPSERPETFKLPADVSATSILNKYLTVVGAKDKMATINSILVKYEANTPMGAVVSEEKRVDGKLAQNIYVGGNLMMSMVATGDGAFAKRGPNKNALPENMANDMNSVAGLFPEINILKTGSAKITGVEEIDGNKAYKVEVSGEVISYTLYYDIATGLKVKEIQTTTVQGKTQTQDATLKDYQDYDGLKFPTTRNATMVGQNIEFKLKEVKVNEGVSDADFD